MKKFLLLSAVAISALAVNAQVSAPMTQMQKVKMQKVVSTEREVMEKAPASAGPNKLLADDLYYLRAAGSYCYGYSKEGMGYYNAFMVVAPNVEYALVNKSSKAADTKWGIGTVPQETIDENYVDENYNFIFEAEPSSGYYMPVLSNENTEYVWGQTDNRKGDSYSSSMCALSEVSPLRTCDPHIGWDYIGWGYLDTNFLFGDGLVVDQETDDDGNVVSSTTYQSYAAMQEFDKPMSPLYVEDIFINVEVFDRNYILADDDVLYLDITDLDGNTLHQLTCTKSDLIEDDASGDYDAGEYGVLHFGTAVFTKKEIDPLSGSEAAEPFVLDQPFRVYIYGFEGKGIGFNGHKYSDETAVDAHKGYNMVYEVGNEENQKAFTFQNSICVPITFSAFFDGVHVWESAYFTNNDDTETTVVEDFNVLKVSADGSSIENAGFPEYEFVCVDVASNWFDEDNNEMYYLANINNEVIDWCFPGVDNSTWVDYDPSTENPGPTCYVSIECDPLEDGVEGRGIKLYVYGRGVRSAEPIYVLQGEYTKEQCDADEIIAGVNSVVASPSVNNKTYNLAGQQVNANYRGVVIKNGVKAIQK